MTPPVPRTTIAALFERFRTEASGAVMVIAALSLPVVIGAVALSTEYGTSLLTRAENQRVSDAAAYAGALAYGASNSEATMVAAARNVARLNGIDVADVTVRLAPSPRAGGGQVVEVVIRENQPLLLAAVLGTLPDLEIVTQSYASLAGGESNCILALSKTGTGITLSGGTSISAPDCAIASNGKVEVPWGTGITTKGVAHLGPVNQPGAGIKTASGAAAPLTAMETPDPLKDHGGVRTLGNRFTLEPEETMLPVPGPTIPPGAAQNIEFAYNDTNTNNQAAAIGCTAQRTGSIWKLTCPYRPQGYTFGTITVGGGLGLDFNSTGDSRQVYNFTGSIVSSTVSMKFSSGTFNVAGDIVTSGSAVTEFGSGTFNVGGRISKEGSARLSFGSGTFNIAKGIHTAGSNGITFGQGTFRVGRSDHNCDNGRFSICNRATLAFGGPSTFDLTSGFFNGGGSRLTFGAGTSNSYFIQASTGGEAIRLGGGSHTHMADALGGSSRFRIEGDVNQVGGGSCFYVAAAANHDIRGNFNAAGGVTLGRGIYTIDGYFALGNNGGGSVWCTDRNVSLLAENVNLVIGGRTLPTGQCANQAFCATAGYNNIVISAPTSGPYAGLAVIGPLSPAISAGFRLAGGAGGGRISGAVYFPNGPITMGGGAGAGGGASDCLTLIGTAITLSGGTSAASECAGLGAGGATRVTLVQ